jgi:hypothetical protein
VFAQLLSPKPLTLIRAFGRASLKELKNAKKTTKKYTKHAKKQRETSGFFFDLAAARTKRARVR